MQRTFSDCGSIILMDVTKMTINIPRHCKTGMGTNNGSFVTELYTSREPFGAAN